MPSDPRPPEGIETWEVVLCDQCGRGIGAFAHQDGCRTGHLDVFTVVRLSALLAEREAKERAERDVDELREQIACFDTPMQRVAEEQTFRAVQAEAERDAAVARAEQAEKERDEWRDAARRQYAEIAEAEAHRDVARKRAEQAEADLAIERGKDQDSGWCSGIRRSVSPITTIQHIVPHRDVSPAIEALRELVRLKDGPRDDAYRAAKDAAWGRARSILARIE